MARNSEKKDRTVTVTLRNGTKLVLRHPDGDHLGTILREAIRESGISQFALARAAGVAQAAVSVFLAGGGLNLESTSRLATVMGLELTQNPEALPKRIEPED